MKKPISVSVAFILILIDAVIWLGFAIITVLGLHPSLPDSELVRWTMTILALLTTGALIGLAIFLRRRIRVSYYLMLGMLALIALLTITDDFGLSDLIVLALNLVPMILLLKNRAWFLKQNEADLKPS